MAKKWNLHSSRWHKCLSTLWFCVCVFCVCVCMCMRTLPSVLHLRNQWWGTCFTRNEARSPSISVFTDMYACCALKRWGGGVGSGTSLVAFRPFICVESSVIIPKCCQLNVLGSSHLNSMCVLKMQRAQQSCNALMKAHVLVLIPPWYSQTAESGTVS